MIVRVKSRDKYGIVVYQPDKAHPMELYLIWLEDNKLTASTKSNLEFVDWQEAKEE